MDKLILGRYIPGQSFLHRLDPRSKLLAMFLFIIVIFWANNLVGNLLALTFVFGLVALSKIKLTYFIRGIMPMIGIILFTTTFGQVLDFSDYGCRLASCLADFFSFCADYPFFNPFDFDDHTSQSFGCH